jgi:hypothetical protein
MNTNDQTILNEQSSRVRNMRLNHTNLCTSDVGALAAVFSKHFDFEVLQQNAESAMLRGSDGFSLVLTVIDANSQPIYPNSVLFNFHISFHVGFVLEHQDEVYAKHKELIDNGYNPQEIKTFKALEKSWTAFYLSVGDGIDIEVTYHTS